MLAFIGSRVSSVYLNLRMKVRNHLSLPMIIKPKFDLGYLFQKSRYYLNDSSHFNGLLQTLKHKDILFIQREICNKCLPSASYCFMPWGIQ